MGLESLPWKYPAAEESPPRRGHDVMIRPAPDVAHFLVHVLGEGHRLLRSALDVEGRTVWYAPRWAVRTACFVRRGSSPASAEMLAAVRDRPEAARAAFALGGAEAAAALGEDWP